MNEQVKEYQSRILPSEVSLSDLTKTPGENRLTDQNGTLPKNVLNQQEIINRHTLKQEVRNQRLIDIGRHSSGTSSEDILNDFRKQQKTSTPLYNRSSSEDSVTLEDFIMIKFISRGTFG